MHTFTIVFQEGDIVQKFNAHYDRWDYWTTIHTEDDAVEAETLCINGRYRIVRGPEQTIILN